MTKTRHGTQPRRQSPGPVTRKPAAVKPWTGEAVTMPRRVGRRFLLAGRLASVALVPAALVAPALSHADVTTSGEAETPPTPARLAVNLRTGSAVGTSGFFAVPGAPYGFFFSASTDPSGKYGAILQGGIGLAYGWSYSPVGLTTPATTVPIGSSDWGVGGGAVGVLQVQNSGVTIKYNAVDGSGGIIFAQDLKGLVNPATTTANLAATATASSPLFNYGGSGTLAFGYTPSTDTLSVTPGMSVWASSPTKVQGFAGLFGAVGVPWWVTNGSWIVGSADAPTPEGLAPPGQGAGTESSNFSVSPFASMLIPSLDQGGQVTAWAPSQAQSPAWPTDGSAPTVAQAQQSSGTPWVIIGTVPGVTVSSGFFGPTIDGKIAEAVSSAYTTVTGWFASPAQGQAPQAATSDGAALAGTQSTANDRVANAFSDMASGPSTAQTYGTLMAMANLGNGPASPVTAATSVQGPTGQVQDWAPQNATSWPDGTPVQQFTGAGVQSPPDGSGGSSDALSGGAGGDPAAPITTPASQAQPQQQTQLQPPDQGDGSTNDGTTGQTYLAGDPGGGGDPGSVPS